MTTAKRKFHEVDVDVQHDEPLSGSRAARRYIGAGEADIDDSSDEEVERDEAHRSGDDRSDNASGSGSSSDSDSEALDYNERWGSAPPDQDMRVEAFSMAQELRRGQFNEAGTYVTHDRRGGAYSDDDDDDDSQDEDGDELGAFDGIEPVDKEGMAKAREAQVAQVAQAQSSKADSEATRAAVAVLCRHLRDGETTGVCLQRLYAGVKRARGKGARGRTGVGVAQQAAQQAIDAVTDSVAVFERRRIVDDVLATSRAAWARLDARLSESGRDGLQ